MKVVLHRHADQKFLYWLLLFYTAISETLITAEILPDTNTIKAVQYLITFVAMGLCAIALYKNRVYNSQGWQFMEELKTGMFVAGTFLVLSLIRSYQAEKFSTESIMQPVQILLPFVFAFFAANELTDREIMQFMQIELLLTIAGYLYTKGFATFNLHNLLSISFKHSYSPFESSAFAEVSAGLAAYFIYYRKKSPVCCVAAVVLSLLVFKRVFVITVLLLLAVSCLGRSDQEVSKKCIKISSVFWIAVAIVYYYICQPSIMARIKYFFDFDLVDFSMARVYRLWYLLENNLPSYGLGSAAGYLNAMRVSWLGRDMEMDFVRLIYEIGFLSVIIFIISYFKICNRNLYCYILITCCFLNLLMSNGLLRYWGWTFRIMTVAFINYRGQNPQKTVSAGNCDMEGKQEELHGRQA